MGYLKRVSVFFVAVVLINYTIIFSQHQEINKLLSSFSRPITVLEMGFDTIVYTHKITHNRAATYVLLLLKNGQKVHEEIMKDRENSIILNPSTLTLHELKTLGRCEHFDVVIVHELPRLVQGNSEETLKAVLKLGDYIFIKDDSGLHELLERYAQKIPESKIIVISPAEILYLFAMHKAGLDIARWNHAKKPDLESPRYPIKSTFTEKKLYKKNVRNAQEWKRGINLMTFIMLHGIKPDNSVIRKNLKRMKGLDHNDLVIGNMIVQGDTIALIDFNDSRRHADPKKCLKAALGLFKHRDRLKDPLRAVSEYQHKLDKSLAAS